jgi:hypothetical protein
MEISILGDLGKLHTGFFIMTGLLAVAVGERGVLVLPAITQDVIPGGERGVLLTPWMGLELVAPGKPQGLFLNPSGLPRGSDLRLGEGGDPSLGP